MNARVRRVLGGRAKPAASPSPSPYPAPRYRAAVVQMEAVHEECVPALVHLLRLNAVEPIVYLPSGIRHARPGFRKHFPDVAGVTRFFPLKSRQHWQELADEIKAADPDLLVMNTFQNQGPTAWAGQHWEGRMLGVVHNPTLMRAANAAMQLVGRRRVGLLTLAPHVTAEMMSGHPEVFGTVATITSAFPTPPDVSPQRSKVRRLAVPGSVNFGSRDYLQLLDSLDVAVKAGVDERFEICVVGGGRDRAALEELVVERGLADHFSFVRLNEAGFVPGTAYYRYLLGSTFLLPLIPRGAKAFRTHKITSAIPTSLGLGVPTVLDRWTATVYDVPGVAYANGHPAEGLVAALSMGDAELAGLRDRLADRYRHEMRRAESELAWALSSIGLRP